MKVMRDYHYRIHRPFKVGTQYAYYAPFLIDRDSQGRMRFRVSYKHNTSWYLLDPKAFKNLKYEVMVNGGAFYKVGVDFGTDGQAFYSNSHYSYVAS